MAISPVTVCNIAQITSSSLQHSPPQIVSKTLNKIVTSNNTPVVASKSSNSDDQDECEFLGSYRNKFRFAIRGDVLEECKNDERLEEHS